MHESTHSTSNIRLLDGDVLGSSASGAVLDYRRKWRDNPVNHVVDDFPVHLDVESTSVCNLRCPFCAGTHEPYPQGFMDVADYTRIIDEGAEKGLCSVKLNFRGEPLLHPRIADMVAYAKKKGLVDVFFNTNASKLTEETAIRLLDAGLDRLIVSFEGYDAQVYERNRVGAVFDAVVQNVHRFAELKQRRGARTGLRLQSVALPDMPDYAAAYRAFWSPWADEISIIDLRDECQDHSTAVSATWECPYPWLRLCVTFSGEVYTCPFMNRAPGSYDWQGLGHIASQSLESIWKGPAMEAIRQGHMQHRAHCQEPCRWCSFRGTEIAKQQAGEQA